MSEQEEWKVAGFREAVNFVGSRTWDMQDYYIPVIIGKDLIMCKCTSTKP
jgi:hypothetical protein